ncbi:MAG TPA: J domain-containing protein [Vicinamibacterales bacterium]|jgi:molecular chaperone DnaJ|nr:J domain-containing protein [Vicinamibacterales bacterium]
MEFYVILGLGPGASSAEIKRAYRRLSRRYHPGVNPGDRQAEAVFARVTEAYETLSDPTRRRQYDAGGGLTASTSGAPATTFEFAGFDFSVAARGTDAATFSELFADVLHPAAAEESKAEPGADLHASVTVTFEESLRGVDRQVVITRQVPCGACGGVGRVRTPEGRCPHCQATGKVRWARGHMVFSKVCAACGGSGRQRFQRCEVCNAHGRLVRSEPLSVHVPAGVVSGSRLRIAERGNMGRGGGRNGDLFIDVHVQPHRQLRREGDHLFLTVPVAVHEAVLGARIEVPTLDGPVKVAIAPGTQAGQQFRVSGRGAPTASGARGDLIIDVRLVLPEVTDERSKALMREFGRLNAEDVRRDLQL